MLGMPTFDLTTERGKQDFQKWITFSIKNEINSYARQVLNLGLEGASGGGGTPTGPAGGVLSGNYPNPSFAVDMATQAELDAAIAGVVYQDTPYLDFDTVTPGASGIGQLAWNDTNGTLEFILKGGNVALDIGQENVALVKHADNTGLTKGKVVYVDGSDGTNKTVRYAQANSEATSSKTFGVMAENATGGSKGFVCTQGIVSNINTLALTEGAAVYVSPTTAGDLTSTKPSAPNHMVLVGFCVRSHASLGVLYISVVNGFELQELHNVSINVGTLANGDVIKYNSSTQLWENVAADDIPAHAATHVPGGSDVLDYSKIIGYGTSLPTWNATTHPVGVLWVVNTTGEPYSLYRSDGVSAWKQVGGGGASITVSDTAPTGAAGALWYNSLTGKTYIYYDSFWVEVGNTGAVDITADTIIPAGMIMPTAGSVEPSGWLYCYGQNLNRTTYARLFTAVGTTYGVGDGSTTFGLPDLRGRAIAGRDDMGGSTAGRLTSAGSGITGTTLGAAGGVQTHTLTTNEMPSHTHTQNSHSHGPPPGSSNYITDVGGGAWMQTSGTFGTFNARNTTAAATATNQNTGGGATHQNTQPTIILNYLIKT